MYLIEGVRYVSLMRSFVRPFQSWSEFFTTLTCCFIIVLVIYLSIDTLEFFINGTFKFYSLYGFWRDIINFIYIFWLNGFINSASEFKASDDPTIRGILERYTSKAVLVDVHSKQNTIIYMFKPKTWLRYFSIQYIVRLEVEHHDGWIRIEGPRMMVKALYKIIKRREKLDYSKSQSLECAVETALAPESEMTRRLTRIQRF